MQTLPLLAAIATLQGLWIASIWWTGAAAHQWKLPFLSLYSLLCVVVVACVSVGVVVKIRSSIEYLVQNEQRLISTLCGIVLCVGGVYACVQLGWPDEQHAFAAARIVAEQGVEWFFANYSQIGWLGRQHPPLVLLLYGGALRVFGSYLFVIRIVALLFGLATLVLTYRLGRTLYDRNTGLLAAVLLLTTPFFFRIGTAGLIDMPATFFFVLSLFLTLRLLRDPTYGLAMVTGLCIGAGLLCRYTVVFLYPLLFSIFVVSGAFQRCMPYLAVMVLVSVGVATPWVAYAAHSGVLAGQQETIGRYSQYVLSTETSKRWLLKALFLRLPSGVGIYNLPLLLLGGWHMIKRRQQSDWLILLWVAAVFVPLILTLPGPRYFLPVFPALSIIMACGGKRIGQDITRVIMLVLLYTSGALFLFVDWYRAAGGLFPH